MTQATRLCPWCGENRALADMRAPGSDRGGTLRVCWPCRSSHPHLAWCNHHGEAHPREAFAPAPEKSAGIRSSCRRALSLRAATYRGAPPRDCPACERTLTVVDFPGTGKMLATCIECTEAHRPLRWCRGCSGWKSVESFTSEGATSRTMLDGYCYHCRRARRHGTTQAAILAKQGSDHPECAACGDEDDLHIHHDHSCCPGRFSCGRCVLGYLCRRCNVAEAQLATPDRALALARYMAAHAA